MTIGFILALMCICVACRCILLRKYDVKWVWGLVPGLNKYKLGKLTKSNVLSIILCIMSMLTLAVFGFCFGYEIWIIKNYSTQIKIPVNGSNLSKIEVVVPNDVANIAIWSKYILIGVAAVTLIFWCIIMWKFTIQQNRNPWWIMLWAIIPVIPYIVFAASSNVVIDGKKYKLQRVAVEEEKTETVERKIVHTTTRKRKKRK